MKIGTSIITLCGILLSYCSYAQEAPHHAKPPQKWLAQKQAFVEKYKDIAMGEMKRLKIPASITLAQGLIESAIGTSELATNAKNYFGMRTDSKWKGEVYYKTSDTAKTQPWKAFPSVEDAFIHHSDNFYDKKYKYGPALALDAMDYVGWSKKLFECGYATNPHYPEELQEVIHLYRLTQYDSLAMGISATPMFAVVEEKVPEPVVVAAPPAPEPVIVAVVEEPKGLFKDYRAGVHERNGRKYVVARKGESAAELAKRCKLNYKKALRFNDLVEGQPLAENQFFYIQKKRNKFKGKNMTHQVEKHENLYEISQYYGVRMKSVRKLNDIKSGEEPAEGEFVYLSQKPAMPPKVIKQSSVSIKKETPKKSKDEVVTIFDQAKSPIASVPQALLKAEQPAEEKKIAPSALQKPKPYSPLPGATQDFVNSSAGNSIATQITLPKTDVVTAPVNLPTEKKIETPVVHAEAPKMHAETPTVHIETPTVHHESTIPTLPVTSPIHIETAKVVEEAPSSISDLFPGEYVAPAETPKLELVHSEDAKKQGLVLIPGPKVEDLPKAPEIVVVNKVTPNHALINEALKKEKTRKGDEPIATPEMLANSGVLIHIVSPGETLFSIAKRYQVPQLTIVRINDLPSQSVKVGQRLYVPDDISTVSN
jgi:LysM repeat protein